MPLPTKFTERMKGLLQDQYGSFIASFDDPRHYGLRVNTLKWDVNRALKELPLQLTPIDWVQEGFYYTEEERPSKHPYYHAGMYYIQEPSAMAPGAIIPVKPGDRVLDLCAAPGGKSTQVAARLMGEGVLVSNDISSDRIKALVKNIELFGVKNAIVTNEAPERLARTFPYFFDCILIDAPCSGEGMFRKNPEMIKSWEQHNIEQCVGMQRDILQEAAKMIKPGGVILYSTCTFAPEENEQQIASFLDTHSEFELERIADIQGFKRGQQDWVDWSRSKREHPLEHTVRLWPQHVKGEGHYLALLRRKSSSEWNTEEAKSQWSEAKMNGGRDRLQALSKEERKILQSFEQDVLTKPFEQMVDGDLVSFKGHIYIKPRNLPSLQGLKIIKSGWYLGEVKKNRFEPSQALALALKAEDARRVMHFQADDEDLYRYLKGETVFQDGEKGWTLITVAGYPLGWAKQVQGFLKNAYPAGWRWLA